MTKEYHKPFIKSLIVVAFVTLIAMVSTKYVLEIYGSIPNSPHKTLEYSSQKSHDTIYSSVGE